MASRFLAGVVSALRREFKGEVALHTYRSPLSCDQAAQLYCSLHVHVITTVIAAGADRWQCKLAALRHAAALGNRPRTVKCEQGLGVES